MFCCPPAFTCRCYKPVRAQFWIRLGNPNHRYKLPKLGSWLGLPTGRASNPAKSSQAVIGRQTLAYFIPFLRHS